ncbi:unnamed protein product [Periconia digitata]|uniref:Glycosyl transferase CAP10 domain-containing protein n=1 Tax=Periconia digitata TaxID=1303443 RepID=A0A9W4XNS7_9PLEO|nr:unnamed protein product [Periconia digitata]
MQVRCSYFTTTPSWGTLRAMAIISMLLCGALWYLTTWRDDATKLRFSESSSGLGQHESSELPSHDEQSKHPIERLMDTAQTEFNALVDGHGHTVADAAENYRRRRGRHPPPGFDAWFAFAQAHDALVVESFFDQIEADLAPLRSIDPYTLRQTANNFSPKITIRNGTVDAPKGSSYIKLAQIATMIQAVAEQEIVQLPDLDIPVNVNDEPAMLVPWETIDTALQFVKPILTPRNETIDSFASIKDVELPVSKFDPEWLNGRNRHTSAQYLGPRPFWSIVRPACPPGSPARDQPLMQDIWHREGHTKEEHLASALLPLGLPEGSYEGFVRNLTTATDVCQNPSWQGLHGAFVAPAHMSVTQKLFPLFSTSKLAISNEILIPNVGDWNVSKQTTSDPVTWAQREDKLYWRGSASGGKNTARNWQRFHRHRFVAMLNATHVEIAEGLIHAGNESIIGLGYARNFRLLPGNEYTLTTQRGANMAEWVNNWGDAAFTDLQCSELGNNGTCPYTDEYFSVSSHDSSLPRNSTITHKYAAVLDGEGGDDSGSFMASLRSGQFTLKASIYRQWYDSRVIPWMHCIPLDNTFVDLYAVMEFFRGPQVKGRNEAFAHAHIEMEKHEHHFNTPPEGKEKRAGYQSRHVGNSSDQTADSNVSEDGQDEKAQRIAEAGQEWASKALTEKDVLIYVYRLLLEYARIKDDRREMLGWVGDLLMEEGKSKP